MSTGRLSAATIGFWLGYVVLLMTVPRMWPPESDLPSAAAAQGYNTGLAFLVAAGWSLIGLVLFGAAARVSVLSRPDAGTSGGRPQQTDDRGRSLEIVGAFVIFAVAYFPTFLARYGHYIEDNYFLSVLLRMACGQVPYRDFEFLYGPLMIYPVHWWISVVGYSMSGYYGFLALAQGAVFAVTVWVLSSTCPTARHGGWSSPSSCRSCSTVSLA